MRVTTTEFVRSFGLLTDRALPGPVTITRDGQDRFVLISAEEYERLRRRDRRVLRPEDLTDAEVAAVAAAEVPPGHDYLNEEARDWRP